MDFISWIVVGALLMLAEIGSGAFYLLALGLACAYPAYYAFHGAPVATQLTALAAGGSAHAAIVLLLRRKKSPGAPAERLPDPIGQSVKITEWMDECTAIVEYRGRQWQADKVDARMPDSGYGVIRAVHGSRLVIATAEAPPAGQDTGASQHT